MSEPILVAALAFITGTFVGPGNRPIPDLLFAAAGIAAYVHFRKRRIAVLPLAIAFLLLGVLAPNLSLPDPDELLDQVDTLTRGPVTIEGHIAETPELGVEGWVLIVSVDRIGPSGAPLTAHAGRVRLIEPDRHAISDRLLLVGAQVALEADLAKPETGFMPAFRARSLAVRRGVTLSGRLLRMALRAPPPAAWAPLRALGARLENAGAPELGLSAFAFGDRSRTPPALDAALLSAGLTQLYGFSGAGLLTLAGIAFILTRRLARRFEEAHATRIAAGCGLCALLVFGASLGATPSVLRTASSLALAFGAALLMGRLDLRHAVPISIILLLGVDSAAVGDTSYQLSIACLTGISNFFPALDERFGSKLGPVARGPLRVVFLGLSLAIATAPLVTRQFDRATLSSVLASAAAIPIQLFLVGPATFAAAWLAPLGAIAHAPELVAELSLRSIRGLAAALGRLDASALVTPTVSECLVFYVAMFAFSMRPLSRRAKAVLGLALLVLFMSMGLGVVSHLLQRDRVLAVLPLGPSGVAVLESEHQVLVLGAGPEGPDPEASRRMLSNYLKHRRIGRVDATWPMDGPRHERIAGLQVESSSTSPGLLQIAAPDLSVTLLQVGTGTAALTLPSTQVLVVSGAFEAIADPRGLLAAARPKLFILSLALTNPPPRYESAERWLAAAKAIGAETARTDRNGLVTVRAGKRGLRMERYVP